jgi:hypothetical protein
VLTLNGVNQYVNVSRNLAMFRDFEIQTAVLWRGGDSNQKVFHFGDDTDHMYLTPANTDGVAEFVIKVGGTVQRLTAAAPLPLGRWTVVTIRKAGNTGTMTFNTGGRISGNNATPIPTVTNNAMTLNPVQVSGKLTNDAVYSLGRGTDGDYFNGSYDYFDVFFKAAPAPTYSYTEIEPIIASRVTFDHNFEGAPANITVTTRADGTLSSLPQPERPNFELVGWFNSRDDDGMNISEAGAAHVFADDITLYAVWRCNHVFDDEWEVVTPPTCTGGGTESRTCTVDGCDENEVRIVNSAGTISITRLTGHPDTEGYERFVITNLTDEVVTTKGLYLSHNVARDSEPDEFLQWRMPAIILRENSSFRLRGSATAGIYNTLKHAYTDFALSDVVNLRLVTSTAESAACWNGSGECLC